MPFLYRTPDLVSYARQEADLTAKSDVFQLGLVICELFTCRNPCKRSRNLLDNVDLESILDVPGVHGPRIKLLIEEMLIPEFNRRPNAGDLIDPWEGVFREVVSLSHQLEGRVI